MGQTNSIQAPRRRDGSLSKKVVDILRRFIDAFSALMAYFDAEAAEVRRGRREDLYLLLSCVCASLLIVFTGPASFRSITSYQSPV